MLTKARILAVSAALCCAATIPARADVTYTWNTLSSTGAGPIAPQPIGISFTLSGDVSLAVTSNFTGGNPIPQVTYQFPAEINSFSFSGDFLSLTLASFKSPLNGNQSQFLDQNEPDQPIWDFALTADTTAQTATLNLDFFGQQAILSGADSNPFPTIATFSTGAVSTIWLAADGAIDCPCSYTGELTAADPTGAVPEPAGIWLLLTALAAAAIVTRRYWFEADQPVGGGSGAVLPETRGMTSHEVL